MGIERDRRSPQNRGVVPERKSPGEAAGVSGQGLQIWGDVRFQTDAVIRADVRGNVVGDEKVIVTEGMVVTGSVEGSDVRIEGEAHGGVVARGKVWMGSKAKVRGRCFGQTVRLEPGAEFRGELQVG